MSIMNILERHKLLNRIPKEKRSELKMIMNRSNFHEIRDVGNEEYVLNVVNQDCVVDKIDTEGHLYLMCASSRFEIKMLRYLMKFGEKNEIVVLREEGQLTDSEEIAWDRYVAEFCSIIKRELDFPVVYSSEIINKQVQKKEVQNTVDPAQETVASTKEEPKKDKFINIQLEDVHKAVASTKEENVTFTVYARNGQFGVGIDAGRTTIGNIKVTDTPDLETVDVVRAISSAIALSQSLGSYLRLMNSNIEITYYLFKDRDIYIDVPEMFNVVDASELSAMNN